MDSIASDWKKKQQQGNESGNVCDKVMYVPDRMETWVLGIIRQTKGHKSIKSSIAFYDFCPCMYISNDFR